MTPTITAIKREATRVFGSCEQASVDREWLGGAGWICIARIARGQSVQISSFTKLGALRDMLALLGALEARR